MESSYVIIILILVLVFCYYLLPTKNEHFDTANTNYKWITQGTCASNKMKDLTQEDCVKYLPDSNYTITPANHGPPGCWLVLGDSLNKVLADNPQFIGKGFGCHSTVKTDGMMCSPDFPCVCK